MVRITANNPSPMTLEGTNTFVLHSSDDASALLIDPGPELAEHRESFFAAIGQRELSAIVLTHHHADHSEMLGSIESWAPEVPVHAADPRFSRHVAPVGDGASVRFGPRSVDSVDVVATPGHTSDSISLLHDNVLYSGDTVLGRGTTVVTHPEGSIADYLDSLGSLLAMANVGQFGVIEPAHGPVIESPVDTLEYYVEHRQERISQVEAAVAAGATTAEAVADVVYADVPDDVRPAVLQIVQAQLDYLAGKR